MLATAAASAFFSFTENMTIFGRSNPMQEIDNNIMINS